MLANGINARAADSWGPNEVGSAGRGLLPLLPPVPDGGRERRAAPELARPAPTTSRGTRHTEELGEERRIHPWGARAPGGTEAAVVKTPAGMASGADGARGHSGSG